jgi:hypothetical protein
MNPEHTRRLIGGIAALLGLWWTSITLFPLISRSWSGELEAFGIVFLLTVITVTVTPGILAVVFGARLFLKMQESSLKWVVGVLAILLGFVLYSGLLGVLPRLLPERLQHTAFPFIASLIAIVTYLMVVRLLLRYFTQEEHPFKSLVSRGSLILLAWRLWMLLSSIFEECDLPEGGFALWHRLGFLMPTIVAYGLYRLAVSRLTKACQESAEI